MKIIAILFAIGLSGAPFVQQARADCGNSEAAAKTCKEKVDDALKEMKAAPTIKEKIENAKEVAKVIKECATCALESFKTEAQKVIDDTKKDIKNK